MITYGDQMQLFRLISEGLKRSVECHAFGGTAMMFYGYKDETKDIDLLFEKTADRNEFVRAIESMGFQEASAFNIYVPEKLRDRHKPLIYKRYDLRFDIFVKKIFHTLMSPGMVEDKYALHEFKAKHKLRVNVLRKEHLVLLKAVTERQNDFDDIKTIARKEKNLDWQYLVDEVKWQAEHGNRRAALDAEMMLAELRKYVFIEEKWLKQLRGML